MAKPKPATVAPLPSTVFTHFKLVHAIDQVRTLRTQLRRTASAQLERHGDALSEALSGLAHDAGVVCTDSGSLSKAERHAYAEIERGLRKAANGCFRLADAIDKSKAEVTQ